MPGSLHKSLEPQWPTKALDYISSKRGKGGGALDDDAVDNLQPQGQQEGALKAEGLLQPWGGGGPCRLSPGELPNLGHT